MRDHSKYHNGSYNSNGFSQNVNYSASTERTDIDVDEIDFKQSFYTLMANKWLIISSVFVCGLIAFLIASFSTPIYQSDGSMLIEDSQGGGGLSGSNEGLTQLLSSTYGIGVGSTLANELQVLQSRKLSLAVADTLMDERLMPNGRQFPVLFRAYPDDSTMTAQDTVAARLRDNTNFHRIDREANVVNLTYKSPAPYEAAHVVNMNMKSYKELSTKQNRSSASSAVSFLNKEQTHIKNDLQKAEGKLRKFMNKSKLVQVDPQTKTLIQQMADLEAGKQKAKAMLVAANSALSQYHKKINEIKPGLAEKYSEAVGPNITKLQYAKSEVQVKKEQLLANNPGLDKSSPRIAKYDQQIKAYKKRIIEITQNLIDQNDQYITFLGGGEGGVAQNISEMNQKMIEMQVQKTQYESQMQVIDEQLQNRKAFFNNLPDNIITLAKLKRDVKINEELFETVSKQYAETALWEQTQFGLGRVIDQGYIPKKPVSPNKRLYLLAGIILGGIFSVGYVFIKESFNISIDSVSKMKELNEPLLAIIPSMDGYFDDVHDGDAFTKVQGKMISTGLITVLDSVSPICESFRRLEGNLIYSYPDKVIKSIVMTSCGKGDGKSTTAANLGVIMAEAGYNTLIVDVDFRRPNMHNIFGLQKTPGLMEAIFDDVPLDEAIQPSIVHGLSILPAGRRPPNAAAVAQSHAFFDVLSKVHAKFDFVIYDTAPIGIINDASALLNKVDGVLLAARFGQTTDIQLNQTLDQLHQLHATIAGTVLVGYDHSKSHDYQMSSGYYKQMYQEYDEYTQEA